MSLLQNILFGIAVVLGVLAIALGLWELRHR